MRSAFHSPGFRWFVVAPSMLAAFVASFLFVTFHLMRAAAIPKREKVVAELDATDPNWRTTALTDARNAKLPPPEQNAAELAHQARQKVSKAFRDWEGKSPSANWRGDVTNPHLPHKADIADTSKQLHKVREAVEAARNVRHVPGGGFHFEYKEPTLLATSLDRQQHLRQVMSLLSYDAAVRAYDRDGNGSLESCLAILAVARGLGDEPTLISQLIRIAGDAICVGATERTLCWTDGCGDAKLAEIDAAFAKEAAEPRLLYGLRGERAVFFRICENIDSGSFDMNAAVNLMGPQVPSPIGLYVRAQLPEEQAVGLEMFNRLIAAAGKPAGKERSAALAEIEDEFTRRIVRRRIGPVPVHLLLGLLMPAIYKIQESDTRIVAQLNAARVAIACERHRLKTGAYPATLDELPKELLAEVPADPFSGKPILYKKLDDGAVAYSTSYDGLDDGAKKLDPKNEKGNDIGFRLWTPEHRRKPPLPKAPDPFAGIGLPGFGIDPEPTPRKSTAPPPISPRVRDE